MSLKEIGEAVGRARSCIQRWFDLYRNHGPKRVLRKEHGGGIGSTLSASAAVGMAEKLTEGARRRAKHAQDWLRQEHGVDGAMSTVYKYLEKCGARLKVPSPSHAKKDAAAAETFKRELVASLRWLGIEKGRSVRIWVADEMRYGRQPVTRHVWSLRGTRVAVPVLPRYDWAYCYGALEVGGGCEELFTAPR